VFEIIVALATCGALIAAAFGGIAFYARLPERHRDDDTAATLRQIASVFGLMASLALGFMINSAKNTFEQMDRNVHVFATDIIILDRSLRTLGSPGEEARLHLKSYLERALGNLPLGRPDKAAEADLKAVGDVLAGASLADPSMADALIDTRAMYWQLVQQRWVLVEQSESALPSVITYLVIAWLVLIFASFGYRAPRNGVVGGVLIVAAVLISATIYVVLDMNQPYEGPIQVSLEPLKRAMSELTG